MGASWQKVLQDDRKNAVGFHLAWLDRITFDNSCAAFPRKFNRRFEQCQRLCLGIECAERLRLARLPSAHGARTGEHDTQRRPFRIGEIAAAGSGDAVMMMPFKPGSYSARVTSGDGTTGTALLEIYEVP